MYQEYNKRIVKVEIEYAIRADPADDLVVPKDGVIKVLDHECRHDDTDWEGTDKWLIHKKPTKRTEKRPVLIKF